VLNE
jgi:hypothetical protein